MIRIDDNGEDAFGVDEIVMQPNETIYFNFLDWGQDGGFLTASIDQDNDGMIDETVELPDELEIFIWDQ
jgi:hypothetical protein